MLVCVVAGDVLPDIGPDSELPPPSAHETTATSRSAAVAAPRIRCVIVMVRVPAFLHELPAEDAEDALLKAPSGTVTAYSAINCRQGAMVRFIS